MDENIYVRPSPNAADKGNSQGLEPRFLSFNELDGLGHPKDPSSAIRAKCLDCCCGSMGEVRKCVVYRCPLWPMRMGSNPFHAKSKHSQDKEKAPSAWQHPGASSENQSTKKASHET